MNSKLQLLYCVAIRPTVPRDLTFAQCDLIAVLVSDGLVAADDVTGTWFVTAEGREMMEENPSTRPRHLHSEYIAREKAARKVLRAGFIKCPWTTSPTTDSDFARAWAASIDSIGMAASLDLFWSIQSRLPENLRAAGDPEGGRDWMLPVLRRRSNRDLPAPTIAQLENAFDELETWIRANGRAVSYRQIENYEQREWYSRWRGEKPREFNRTYMFNFNSGRVQTYAVGDDFGNGVTMMRTNDQEPWVPNGYHLSGIHANRPRRSVADCAADFLANR